MKIFDMHIHADGGKPDADALISRMESAGIFGGVIFSQKPDAADFETRLSGVLEWTKGYEGRLFPVMWIHPFEEDAVNKARLAAQKGICGFKMICQDYYVYDAECIRLLETIAELGLPVFFHTGILWDGKVSSDYNRPVNWERLIEIKGLRFSLAHCSWPWHDECIALYGKILNSYTKNSQAAEMFFDLTPGTPPIYRRDLLTKLFGVGYDVPHNIMFGTDCSTSSYNPRWVRQWLDIDNALYDELDIPQKVREFIYSGNLMRFLGLEKKDFTHISPVSDGSTSWSLDIYR